MFKLSTFVVLLICFVCLHAEQNVDNQSYSSKLQTSIKQNEENTNSPRKTKEKNAGGVKSHGPCKESQNHDLDDEYSNDDPERYKSLPLATRTENNKTDDVDNSNEVILRNTLNDDSDELHNNDDCGLSDDESTLSNAELDDLVLGDRNDDPISTNTDSVKHKSPCKKVLNNNKKLDSNEIVSKGRRILPGIIKNPTDKESQDNKLYQDKPQSIPYDAIEKGTRRKDIKDNENFQSNPVENLNDSPLNEPTQGEGIYDVKETSVMLLENTRICYACSTINDPTCWLPGRKTTVKYCPKGQDACVTKTFSYRGKTVLIRDCGNYCVNLLSGEKNHKSCSICHTDLCNGASASSATIYTTSFATIVLFGIFFNTR